MELEEDCQGDAVVVEPEAPEDVLRRRNNHHLSDLEAAKDLEEEEELEYEMADFDEDEQEEELEGPDFPLIKCLYCSFSATEEDAMIAHMSDDHENVSAKDLSAVNSLYETLFRVATVESEGGARQPFTCAADRSCSYTSRFKNNLITHVKAVHINLQDIKCDICDFRTAANSALKTHVNSVHLKIKNLNCAFCDFVTTDRRALHLHTKTKHPQPAKTRKVLYQCGQCEFSTGKPFNMRLHIKSMHKKRDYACTDCDFNGANRADLNRHFRQIHLRDKRFVCKLCLFRANNRENFLSHLEGKHQTEVDRKLWQILKCDENLRDEEKLLIPKIGTSMNSSISTSSPLTAAAAAASSSASPLSLVNFPSKVGVLNDFDRFSSALGGSSRDLFQRSFESHLAKTLFSNAAASQNPHPAPPHHHQVQKQQQQPHGNPATSSSRVNHRGGAQHRVYTEAEARNVKFHYCRYCDYKSPYKGNVTKHEKRMHKKEFAADLTASGGTPASPAFPTSNPRRQQQQHHQQQQQQQHHHQPSSSGMLDSNFMLPFLKGNTDLNAMSSALLSAQAALSMQAAAAQAAARHKNPA